MTRLTLVVAALSGCGHDSAKTDKPARTSGDPMPAAGTGKKPCEYMARADAEKAIGLSLPQTSENVTLGMCDYTTAEYYGASLTLGEWESVKLAATSGGGTTHPPVNVTGVGDEALDLSGHLYVRKGDRGFMVQLNGPAVDGLPDKGLARAKVLALQILPNI